MDSGDNFDFNIQSLVSRVLFYSNLQGSCFRYFTENIISFKGGLGAGKNLIRFSEINETYQALSPLNKVIPINGASANVYSISMEIQEQITNCSEESMTPCIESFYERRFGNSYDSLIGRSHNFTLAAFDGIDTLESITGK